MLIREVFAAQSVKPGGIINPTNYTDSPSGIGNLISNLISAATVIAGLIFLAFLIVGGIKYATSGGDKVAAESARNTITNALIGLIIVVAATFIVALVQAVLGINILSPLFIGPQWGINP
ncbi:MAG: pilin [Patescibacteria group bacterium]|nr:pilin [Patescibacteria group bacterium]